jgi:tripartite-type tricarboxylate transporter receptor subunit TctC
VLDGEETKAGPEEKTMPITRRAVPRVLLVVLAAVAIARFDGTPLLAQGDPALNYPTKPIRIVVGFGPGGGNDIFARLIGQQLSERLGQPVLVENKPGAGATIATDYVARQPADGYTLLVGATGAMTISPAVYSKLSYVTLRDFVPVSMIASFPLLVTVNADAPVKSIAELIAYAKANPQKANYASSSPAFRLATELFKQKTGAPLEHVGYKSSGEMLAAVVSGEVLVALADTPPVAGHLKAGRVRALAVTSAQRLEALPDVPTMPEAGVRDLDLRLWSGVFVPAATPPAIVKKLETEVMEIIKLPDVRERLKELSVDPAGNTSQEFSRMIANELPVWQAIARTANIKLD